VDIREGGIAIAPDEAVVSSLKFCAIPTVVFRPAVGALSIRNLMSCCESGSIAICSSITNRPSAAILLDM
jgi:hypothetical protein